MKLNDIKDLIVDRYTRRAAKLSSLNLEGPAGIGKTEIVRQAAQECGVPCKVVCLTAMEAADFSGLPMVDPKTGETKYARPNWLPEGPAFVFFDEANRAATDTKQPLLTLIQDRHVNGHAVHPDCMFIFAGNTGDAYDVQEMDPAFKDRMAHIKVEADYKALTGLLGQRYPGGIIEMNWLISQAKHSPRRIEYTLRSIEGVKKNSSLYLALLTAEIGAEGAGALVSYMNKQKVLTMETVQYKKDGELTKESAQLIKDTWEKGTEAVPTFTNLAKEIIAQINVAGKSKDKKDFGKYVRQLMQVADATGDTGCASIILDLYAEVEDRNELCVKYFEAVKKKDPSLEIFRKLLADDIAKVEYQK